MYIATFYSYKGGVGRTMGLANVAWELARRGRRVLIVDLDLEAPGITSFDFCKTMQDSLGVVDYIVQYSNKLEPPNIEPFISLCKKKDEDGEDVQLWVMSAGRQDADYKQKFHSINWEHLYKEQSGFLMFENLKGQWKDYIKPDYVLIDSRTGHTDISGICTRQLPDAVVFTFFPNRQNLAGLKDVVREVREEGGAPRKKNIRTHFVASNVPNADDDLGILAAHLAQFEDALEYDRLQKIHYYNNLSIVDQVIFTLTKRNTQLAREYIELANAIIKGNAEDPEGALMYLDEISSTGSSASVSNPQVDRMMADIRLAHPKNAQIHSKLAKVLMDRGRNTEALAEWQLALSLGASDANSFANLGQLYRQMGKSSEASEMFVRLAEGSDKNDVNVYYAIMQLAEFDKESAFKIVSSERMKRVDINTALAIQNTLRTDRSLVPAAITLLQSMAERDDLAEDNRQTIRINITLSYIAIGEFEKAMAALGERDEVLASGEIVSTFNYAMAEWGQKKIAPIDFLERVLEIAKASPRRAIQPNYAQCMATVSAALSDFKTATEWLEIARARANDRYKQWHEFSCWTYLNVTMRDFLEDLVEMDSAIKAKVFLPSFITSNALAH